MRLDVFLLKNEYFKSRTKAAEAVSRGEVFVNGKQALKTSSDVTENDLIEVKFEKIPFVSLGGYKLQKAIDAVNPPISGGVFIDVGASTGGFTDCLLRNGVSKVYCIDVGKNLLDESIATDKRVIVMDETNARFLTEKDFDEKVDGIVVDCSFISLEYILPPLKPLLKENGYLFALIKPQFETGKKARVKNGVLKDEREIYDILNKIYDVACLNGYFPFSLTAVSDNKKKNREFIIGLKIRGDTVPFDLLLEKAAILKRR